MVTAMDVRQRAQISRGFANDGFVNKLIPVNQSARVE